MRPNVLLIVLDSARADALEPYGAPPGSSPVIAELAARGRALPHVYANACWTVPSHAALFTGLLPRAAGLSKAPGGSPAGCQAPMAASRDRLLPEIFRRANYDTRAVSTNLWLTEASGFDLGFDQFISVDTQRQGAMHRTDWRGRLRWGLEAVRARADDGASEALEVMRAWAREPAGERPFFWFVNLIETHTPYLPPRPFHGLGPVGRWRAAAEAREHLTLDEIWRACAGGPPPPSDALERMKALYAASVRLADQWIGDLLEALDKAGKAESTLVAVIADHGENFGEAGLMAHAFSLDNRVLHVPCVVAGPNHPRDEEALGLDRLPQLLARAAEIDPHPWQEAEPAGVAVAQFDPPTTDRDYPGLREGVERWGLSEEAIDRLTTPMTAAQDTRFKLLLRGAEESLFDLEADPLEQRPTTADDDERIERLRSALHRGAEGVGMPAKSHATTDVSREERAALEERMRLLGYL